MKSVAAIVIAYAILGLAVLVPEAIYSGDIGVTFVQARALAANRFASLDIPYPGEFLDPGRDFFPIRAPFVMRVGATLQTIFSPASAVLQGGMAALAGLRGMVLSSLIAALVILLATRRMAPAEVQLPVVLALGLGSPLWFYAVTGWEHAPAVAFSTAGFAVAICSERRGWPLLAGILVAAGATLRDEVILLLPGLFLVTWLRNRTLHSLALALTGVAAPLIGGALVEVAWFGRPLAAHLRHAVHLLQSAAHTTSGPNPELPALAPFTLRERYETVVQYWLLGYGRDGWILVYLSGLSAALVARWRLRTSAPLLAWVLAVVALAVADTWAVVTAPKFLAGAQRVAPYLCFSVLPGPLSAKRTGRLHWPVAFTALAFVILAFAGVDTSGGKSLGPRLLLPLFPLLTVTAVASIAAYMRCDGAWDRLIGRLGALMVALAIGSHMLGTVRAYEQRNRIDAFPILTAKDSTARVLIADDEFTAQLLLPLYYRKIVFLADTPEQGRRLAALLVDGKVAEVLLISRSLTPAIHLAPLRLQSVLRSGRFNIQRWSR
jgi:hypothetical protein